MDRGRMVSPAEYEEQYNNEMERDRKNREQWEEMKRDPSYKTNFEIQEELIELIQQERKERITL